MNTQIDSLSQLLGIMRRLRDPVSGCEWDVRQNFQSIAPFTIEEAYEVADAIERNDLDDLCDELGDLLFQVVFHAHMAEEMGAFTFNDVVQSIVDKMIRRHPHVFSGRVYESEAAQKAGWDAIKAEERKLKQARRQAQSQKTEEHADALPPLESVATESALDGVARTLPSLKRADKVQKRAARVGFDWPDISPVWDKLDEEIAEVQAALQVGDSNAIEDEIGDLLFTVVNLARHCSIDSEQALQRATAKFDSRFRRVEVLAGGSEALILKELSLERLDELWDLAKTLTREEPD